MDSKSGEALLFKEELESRADKMSTRMKEEYRSITVGAIDTPDGKLYYTMLFDDKDNLVRVISTFGKAGSSVAAWAQGLDQLVNLLLEKNTPINDIIECLSGITTEKSKKTTEGVRVGSGPEGMVVALMEFKRMKFIELREKFGGA